MGKLENITLSLMSLAVAASLTFKSPKDVSLHAPVLDLYIPKKIEQVENPDSTLAERASRLVEEHSVIKNWISIFTMPESIRVVVDKRTMDIVDTLYTNEKQALKRVKVPDPQTDSKKLRKFIKDYFKHHPEYSNHTTINGMRQYFIDGFYRYSLYSEIIRRPFIESSTDLALSFIILPESGVLPATSYEKVNGRKQILAKGPMQITKPEIGDLVVNNQIDERDALVPALKRGFEILQTAEVYGSDLTKATRYIKGLFGVAVNLEMMLNLAPDDSRMFPTYSDMVKFHAPNDMKPYEFDKAITKLQGYKPTLWRGMMDNIKDPELAKVVMYMKYIAEVNDLPKPGFPEFRSPDKSPYIRSFLSYYNSSENPDSLFWKLNEFMISRGMFASPHYGYEMFAAIELYYHPEKYGFSFTRAEPIDYGVFSAPKKMKITDMIAATDTNTINVLNGHIKDKKRISKNTQIYYPREIYHISPMQNP